MMAVAQQAHQTIVTLDLEGVLVPEIWIAVADTTGIPARIIIYTTDLGDDFESIDGLGASDFAQVLAIQ